MLAPHSALLVVDVQKDFLPGGSLSVPDGDQVIPTINKLSELPFPGGTFYSKDWHPSDHISFYINHSDTKPFEEIILSDGTKQTLWPPHCIQETTGADFADSLNIADGSIVVKKGIDRQYDSYSAFCDNNSNAKTELGGMLLERGVKTLYVCGLALDVCVLFSVLDAVKLGLDVCLIEDGCKGLSKESNAKAISQMKEAGASIINSSQML